MKIFGFQSQIWWTRWGLRYNMIDDDPYPDIYRGIRDHFLIVGPFQFRWKTFMKAQSHDH